MRCSICGIEVESLEDAILDDWLPYFYEGEMEHGPVCSSCAETMINIGEDGEMELKAEYHGMVQYMDGDYAGKPRKEDLVIEIFMREQRREQNH